MKFAGIYIGEPSKRSAEEVCCRSNVCSKLETEKSNDPVPQLTLGATSTQALHPAICGRRAITNVSLEEQARSALQLAEVLFRDTYATWFENDGRAERPGLKGLAVFGSHLHLSTSHQVAVAHWRF